MRLAQKSKFLSEVDNSLPPGPCISRRPAGRLLNRIVWVTHPDMEYKGFVVTAFERAPNKWRARIQRRDGKPLWTSRRKKLKEFVTGLDTKSPTASLLLAIQAIDAGTFSRNNKTAATQD